MMPSILFDSAVLKPVPPAEPGSRLLRRRASAPELADTRSIAGDTSQHYEAGNTISLQVKDRFVKAKIIKSFTPFTMAQAMVVQIFEPTLDLEGAYVLKLYDRRYFQTLRENNNADWSAFKDSEFEKRRWSKVFVNFFLHLMANDCIFYRGEDFWGDDDDNGKDDIAGYNEAESVAYHELLYEVDCLKRYRVELEVYRRAREHGIDGKDIPRFISSVRVPPTYTSRFCKTESSKIKGIPGILMQYVPGFSMIDLYDTPSPKPPSEDWKSIIDDALHTVQYWVQNMNFRNLDGSIARNSVVHWDPINQKWKCKLIDFGNCAVRKKGMRKWEWRTLQAWLQEESAICNVMGGNLKRYKGFQYTGKLSQYSEELDRDFNMEYSTGIEPDGYES